MKSRVCTGLLLLLSVITGCYTLKSVYKPVQWLGAFPADSSGYLVVRNNPGWLLSGLSMKNITNNKDARTLLEKTDSVYGAFKILTDGTVEFSFILLGNYPYCGANLSLDSSREWQRRNKPAPYFVHSGDNLKIAIPDWYLILITNGSMDSLLNSYRQAGGLSLEPEIEDYLETADLFCYFPHFAEEIIPDNIPFNREKLPVHAAWMYGDMMDNTCDLGGGFALQEENQALLFRKGFRLFLPWWMKASGISTGEAAGKLRNVELAVKDSTVNFMHLSLTTKELENGLGVFTDRDSITGSTVTREKTGSP